MAEETAVIYAVDQGVATITLNRPHRRNAFTQEMLQALRHSFTRAGEDASVRAVLVTGAGKGFCAGQDLSIFNGIPQPEEVRTVVLDFYRPMIESIVNLKKPVIAAINGVAAGAGASLALACDLRIMAHDASILMAFSNIGLVPDAGASWFLTRLVGYSRAYEIAALGERISAERSLELGLTNWVTGADTLHEDALSRARQLAERPTVALGMTKAVLLQATEATLDATILLEAALQAQAVATADHREGVLAFVEKRTPRFRGQ
ncbi:MAG TPA: enoyl-CoA hydratase-related protein [Caldilineaceae bacterium]|nr:enoyl-CoA hydratase-related protein [Caldilineaceae bacterium]